MVAAGIVRRNFRHRSSQSTSIGQKLSITVFVSLALMVGVVSALWGQDIPPASDQVRMPPDESPFPTFSASSNIDVVSVGRDVNYSTRLTLVSIQGLVNRDRVELYLDFQNESSNATSMLTFISRKYGVSYNIRDIDEILYRYLPTARGFFVYDPGKPESVNIGTMYAGIHGLVIVSPDTAAYLSRISGLPIFLNYAVSDWARLDAVGAYEKALEELYPLSYNRLLAILPPDRFAIRDYLIATKTFVFYYSQGPLAAPNDISATIRILRAAPRGIPIVGWLSTPTLTEENAFVQLASSEGKYLLGVQDVPNLSVLSALGRNQTFKQTDAESASYTLKSKTYAVVAIPDGDNLDFAADRMRELWNSSIRGSFPIAWSLNPLLVDLAPPFFDYYYDTASESDRFIAGPSGAGYLYPDYLRKGDLKPFLEFSKRYMEAADMDVVWLLNAFKASEIPYNSESLSAYVETLKPRGIALDYHDQPTTRDYWMQGANSQASPVIRSTHLWTTKENFLGKVQADMDAWDDGAHFLWITIYPWRFNLTDAKSVIDELTDRMQGELEIVTPETFFSLLTQDFQVRAKARLQSMNSDLFAVTVLSQRLSSAQDHIEAANAASSRGDHAVAAYEAFLAMEDMRAATMWEAIAAMSLIALVAVGFSVFRLRSRETERERMWLAVLPFLALTATTAIFFLTLRATLNANFWTYQFVAIGIAAMGIAAPLKSYLDENFGPRALSVSALLFLMSAGLTIQTNSAFPLTVITALLLIRSQLSRYGASTYVILSSFLLGVAVGFVISVDFLVFVIASAPLVACVLLAPEEVPQPSKPSGDAWFIGLAVSLPLVALATFHYHSLTLRLELQADSLVVLAVALLTSCLVLGLSIAGLGGKARPEILQNLSLLLAGTFAILLLFAEGTLMTSMVFLGMLTGLALFAHTSLNMLFSRGGSLLSVVRPALIISILLIMFMRMPRIVYSLLITRLPEWLEYVLYAPQVAIAAITLVMIVTVNLSRGGK